MDIKWVEKDKIGTCPYGPESTQRQTGTHIGLSPYLSLPTQWWGVLQEKDYQIKECVARNKSTAYRLQESEKREK